MSAQHKNTIPTKDQADASNKRRKARVAKQAERARIKARDEELARMAAEKARREAEEVEEARVAEEVRRRAEEDRMFEEAEKVKEPKKSVRRGSIKVAMNGTEYASINAALRGTGEEYWAEETPFRRAAWTKINRNLKKVGFVEVNGYKFEAI